MKIAIIQEWLVSVGGSDKVVKAISDIYPEADIFTLVSSKETLNELKIDSKRVTNSFIQKFPRSRKNHRIYLPLFPIAIEQFNLSDYDLIISSSHSVAKGVLTHGNQLHICYCHSPMRYAWDLYHSYLNEARLDKGIKGVLAKYFLHRIRIWDIASLPRVDHFIANSNYIARRIKKIYNRESTVIYPNIEIDAFLLNEKKDDFYLACSRLVSYKKIDLIVEAFTKWGKRKLVVLGSGPDFKKIKEIAGNNVEIRGYSPKEQLTEYMGKCKALVFASDEDFGMIPVEAQACGTPVIAFGKGGSLETIIENKTGMFFKEQTVDSLIETLNRFEKSGVEFSPHQIREHATRFGEVRFKKEFKQFVDLKLKNFKNG